HVGRGDEPFEDLAALRALEIEGDRALVGTLGEIARPHLLLVEASVATRVAALVVVVGVLDLDDVGPQQGQLIGCERPGQHVGNVDDADALEWPPRVLRARERSTSGARVDMGPDRRSARTIPRTPPRSGPSIGCSHCDAWSMIRPPPIRPAHRPSGGADASTI